MRMPHLIVILPIMAVAGFELDAQPPLGVDVHLPYQVLAGKVDLPPGDYTIRRLGADDIFAVYAGHGMKFETLLRAIPEEERGGAPRTALFLRGSGGEYSLDRMWIEGRSMGYEFLNPARAKSIERERGARLEVPATKGE